MAKLSLPSKKEQPKDLNSYLKTSEEISDEMNEDIERVVQEDFPSISSKGSKSIKFWSNWPKKKKVLALASTILSSIILLFLILFFVIRPAKTSSFIKASWHEVIAESADLDRSVRSEVNLEGTRDVAASLDKYNQKLASISYAAKGKSSLMYKSGTTNLYGDITSKMGEYFSDSATILVKSDTDISSISDSELQDLKDRGEYLKNKVDDFRKSNALQEELNPDIFALDQYIQDVKLTSEEIAQEREEEEQKKEAEKQAAIAKDNKDKASVQTVGETYLTAFVNGSEDGVRSTLTKGYQGEYDYESLKAERRTNFYPKSHRIVSVEKDSANYKLTASVTYTSIYQDSEGNNIETVQPITLIYRVIFVESTQSWKIDGQIDR
ncbi:MAG: hypothetical protein QG623_332 [Patescibacteria group bacterium]|nr:hypothetical protein [Patescibacteria group bacterium]